MKHSGDDSECMARLAAGDAQRAARALSNVMAARCCAFPRRCAARGRRPKTWCTTLSSRCCASRILFDPAQGSVFGYLCGVLRHRVSRHFRQQKRWVALDTDDDASRAHVQRVHGPADEIARSEVTRRVPPRHARTTAAASRNHRAVRSRRTAVPRGGRHPRLPDRHRALAPASRACAAHHSPGLARAHRSRDRAAAGTRGFMTEDLASARRAVCSRNIAAISRTLRPVMTWMRGSALLVADGRRNFAAAGARRVRRAPWFWAAAAGLAALAIGAGILIGMRWNARASTRRHGPRAGRPAAARGPLAVAHRFGGAADSGGILGAGHAGGRRSEPHSTGNALLDRRRGVERRHLPHRAHRAGGADQRTRRERHDGVAPQIAVSAVPSLALVLHCGARG